MLKYLNNLLILPMNIYVQFDGKFINWLYNTQKIYSLPQNFKSFLTNELFVMRCQLIWSELSSEFTCLFILSTQFYCLLILMQAIRMICQLRCCFFSLWCKQFRFPVNSDNASSLFDANNPDFLSTQMLPLPTLMQKIWIVHQLR